MSIKKPLTRLVLSGGGPRGLGILGALHYIYEQGGLDNINEYWGTSIGSVLCLLLMIGYTPFEIFHQLFMMDYFTGGADLECHDIWDTTAFCPIESLGDKIALFIRNKIGNRCWTFKKLYKKFHTKIHIIGSNTDTMSGECFNVDTQPNMNVLDAIEISCDLPYIFTKKEYQGQRYVDGGFINNYPINLADDGQHGVLGICASGSMKMVGDDHIGWIYRLLHMPIMELQRLRLENLTPMCVHVELDIDTVSMLDMSPSKPVKIATFSQGYQQARTRWGGGVCAVVDPTIDETINGWEPWEPDWGTF